AHGAQAANLVALERAEVRRGHDRRRGAVGVRVHADDDRLARFDAHLIVVRAASDFLLEERRLDRLGRAAERFDVVAPSQGIAVSAAPDSLAMICCVRNASVAACSVGSASASSYPFVWSDCVPPSTADSA